MTRDEWLRMPREIREAIRKPESKSRARGMKYGCKVVGPERPVLYRRMLAIYRDCLMLNMKGNTRYEVDHVIALANGGRHHPDNLAIIPMTENRSKGAR